MANNNQQNAPSKSKKRKQEYMDKKRKRQQKSQEIVKKRKIKDAKSEHQQDAEKKIEESNSFSAKLSKETGSRDKFEVMNQQIQEIQRFRRLRDGGEQDSTEVFAENESYIERDGSLINPKQLIDDESQQLSILEQVLATTDKKRAAKITETSKKQQQDQKQKHIQKNKGQFTKKMAIHCDYVGTGEYGYQDQLAQVCLVNELNECVYIQRVRPEQEITDYRTEETGLSGNSFAQSIPLTLVREQLLGHLVEAHSDNKRKKVLIGHNLTRHIRHLFGKYNVQVQRDIARFNPIYNCALPRTSDVKNVSASSKDAIPDELPVESLSTMAAKYLGISQDTLATEPVLKAQSVMGIYKMFEREYDLFFTKNATVQQEETETVQEQLSGQSKKKKEKMTKHVQKNKQLVEEVKHRVNVRKQLDDTIDSLLMQMKGSK